MLLEKISNLKNTLLFRLTVLHATAFVVLSFVSFLILYYRIYLISMETVDLLSGIEVCVENSPFKLAGFFYKCDRPRFRI
jgi:hypothetical protein